MNEGKAGGERMNDNAELEIVKLKMDRAGNAPTSGERVWLAPALPRSIKPLISGLGIELLAPGDRDRATIRVEALTRQGLRIDRADGKILKPQDVHEARDAPKPMMRIMRSNSRGPACGLRRVTSSRRHLVSSHPY